MDESYECLILLAYLEDPKSWSEVELQSAIVSVIDLVNTAADITGIYAAGLMVDLWGDDPLISFFVQHVSGKYESPEDADAMIVATFTKAIELQGLQEDIWILDHDERSYLDAES